MRQDIAKFVPLAIAVPVELERVFGHRPKTRLVADRSATAGIIIHLEM
jgi:hypothetical protein